MMHAGSYLLSAVLAALVVACALMLVRLRRMLRAAGDEHLRVMRALTSDRDEMEAALTSMVDAVLAVDPQRRLISFNDPAATLLQLRADRHAGLPIDRLDIPASVRALADRSLALDGPVVEDVELLAADPTGGDATPEPRLFQATASPLRHRGVDKRIGSLIVLHDVTRLRRLEVVRRDFVTNASHEIRTPVAAIKMAAETLDDDAAPVDPQTARRFLKIIARQADRLQNLIDDLLSLARIERDTEAHRTPLKAQPILALLESAAEACRTAATPRGTRIEIDCPRDLEAQVNAPLLEQAVMNLLDNAVKYSPDHSLVRCAGERVNGEIVVSVIDRGAGIEPEQLPRVFERFYRTDKARSRELGGTGLGLSIVKHIAQAHAGRVSADSTPGRGSTFRLHIPLVSGDLPSTKGPPSGLIAALPSDEESR